MLLSRFKKAPGILEAVSSLQLPPLSDEEWTSPAFLDMGVFLLVTVIITVI
jgi:hypothetical protein